MTEFRTLSLLMGLALVSAGADAQSDFEEYVASIRDSGMSESAAGSVRTVAGILAGQTTFKATPTPDGSVGRSYSSKALKRSSDPVERGLLATQTTGLYAWVEFLKARADTDHSGFVNTREGSAIRRLIEMGLVADQLKVQSVEELERAEPGNASEVDVAAYAALRAEALKQGLDGLPPLPAGLAPNSQELK